MNLENIFPGVKVSLIAESKIFNHYFQTILVCLQHLSVCSIGCNVCLVGFIISLKFILCLNYSAHIFTIFLEPMTTCAPNAIYQNGRCYVAHVAEEPLSFYNAQMKCRKEVMLQFVNFCWQKFRNSNKYLQNCAAKVPGNW